jgi:hypothetical protein
MINSDLIYETESMITRTSIIYISDGFKLSDGVTGTLIAYRLLGFVLINFDLNLPSSYTSDSAFLFAKTTNYKPAYAVLFNAMRGYSSVTGMYCRGTINYDGELFFYCPSNSSGAIKGSAVYRIQETNSVDEQSVI